ILGAGGLILLAAAGCQSYSPYGYSSPGTYTYPPPPGGTYVPSGPVVTPSNPTPIPATPSSPQGFNSPSGGPSSAPPFRGGSGSGGAGGKRVPDYSDPTGSRPTTAPPQTDLFDEGADDFKTPVKTNELRNMEEEGFKKGTGRDNSMNERQPFGDDFE